MTKILKTLIVITLFMIVFPAYGNSIKIPDEKTITYSSSLQGVYSQYNNNFTIDYIVATYSIIKTEEFSHYKYFDPDPKTQIYYGSWRTTTIFPDTKFNIKVITEYTKGNDGSWVQTSVDYDTVTYTPIIQTRVVSEVPLPAAWILVAPLVVGLWGGRLLRKGS